MKKQEKQSVNMKLNVSRSIVRSSQSRTDDLRRKQVKRKLLLKNLNANRARKRSRLRNNLSSTATPTNTSKQ